MIYLKLKKPLDISHLSFTDILQNYNENLPTQNIIPNFDRYNYQLLTPPGSKVEVWHSEKYRGTILWNDKENLRHRVKGPSYYEYEHNKLQKVYYYKYDRLFRLNAPAKYDLFSNKCYFIDYNDNAVGSHNFSII